MLRKFDEQLLRQFQRLAAAIYRRTGITNFQISKGILYLGLTTCLSESILDFKYRTVDFVTYFLFVYVLVIGVFIIPMLNSQQRFAATHPTVPNRMSTCMAFFRKATAVLLLFTVVRQFFNFNLDAVPVDLPGLVQRTSLNQWILNEAELLISFLFFYFASVKPSAPERPTPAGQ